MSSHVACKPSLGGILLILASLIRCDLKAFLEIIGTGRWDSTRAIFTGLSAISNTGINGGCNSDRKQQTLSASRFAENIRERMFCRPTKVPKAKCCRTQICPDGTIARIGIDEYVEFSL